MPANKKRRVSVFLVMAVCLACLGSPLLYYLGRPLPVAMQTEPFQGVKYYRRVHFTPYPMVAHIVVVDLQAPGIGFLVTAGDPSEALPLKARTTSQFARSTGVQIAINGDGFTPWHANGPFDYFPHIGDRVAPAGYAMSEGVVYGEGPGPTIYFSKDAEASFTLGDITPYNAISGNNMIVVNGEAVDGLDNSYAAPRTAIGLDESGKKLILFVADGRQPFYSQGATLYRNGTIDDLLWCRQCHEYGWRRLFHAGDAQFSWNCPGDQFPDPDRHPGTGKAGGESSRYFCTALIAKAVGILL